MLRRSWIDREEMKILSSELARTKSGKWRVMPITEGAREGLALLPGKDLLLPHMTRPSMSRAFKNDAARAQLDGSPRHTYWSHFVVAGVSLRTVQLLAGPGVP
ncbi:MAG TPA: hypothetical protein VFA81_05680 [Burkholderiales bacterium]|nr:hypothetical protein [Burkholderiales bacterium]